MFRAVLSNTVASNHTWLFKFKFVKIKHNEKLNSSVALATFPLLNRRMWLEADILASTDGEHSHHHRRSYGTVLLQSILGMIILVIIINTLEKFIA